MLEIDARDADAAGHEPVRLSNEVIGMTTSGGYGYRVQKSLAMALVDTRHAKMGTKVIVDVVGERRPAKIIEMQPYDPAGSRMRR